MIKTITFRIALGPELNEFWAQHGPQEGAPEINFQGFLKLLGPSWGQDGPTSLQGAFWERFLMVLAPNLVDFGLQLGGF